MDKCPFCGAGVRSESPLPGMYGFRCNTAAVDGLPLIQGDMCKLICSERSLRLAAEARLGMMWMLARDMGCDCGDHNDPPCIPCQIMDAGKSTPAPLAVVRRNATWDQSLPPNSDLHGKMHANVYWDGEPRPVTVVVMAEKS